MYSKRIPGYAPAQTRRSQRLEDQPTGSDGIGSQSAGFSSFRIAHAAWAAICIAAAILASAQSSVAPGGALRTDKICLPTALNQPPDANAQMQLRDQHKKPQDFAGANAERKKQIADDSAKLLKLAGDLKAEVDKTTRDTLSLAVIRKADEIEKLAHSVKEKMKLSAAEK